MTSISVIVITKNEEKNIRRCLESVKWANELIVLDSGSSDDTVTIAREYTSKVYVTDWPGYGAQKNRALEKASCEWVLSLDADEWLSDELAQEIQKELHAPRADAYCFKRTNIYWGKALKFGNEGHDYVLRLFRKKEGTFKNVIVHECVVTKSKPFKLKHCMYHDCFKDFEASMATLNNYSTLTAQKHYNNGKRCHWFGRVILSSTFAFIRTYVFRLGFLDGKKGLMAAIHNAEGCYYRYLKLWYMSIGANK